MRAQRVASQHGLRELERRSERQSDEDAQTGGSLKDDCFASINFIFAKPLVLEKTF